MKKALLPILALLLSMATGCQQASIDSANDNALYRWLFDGLKANGAKYDVIGMSLYPEPSTWSSLDAQCLTNMNDMVARYGKEVMICEIGMAVNDPTNTKAFVKDIITKTKAVTGGKGIGVFYWEPQCYNNWQGYGKGAFGSNGRPTIALDGFL